MYLRDSGNAEVKFRSLREEQNEMLCTICYGYYFKKIDWILCGICAVFPEKNVVLCGICSVFPGKYMYLYSYRVRLNGSTEILVTTHSHLQTFVAHCIHCKSGRKPITLFYILKYINNLMYVHINEYIHKCI